MPDNPLWNPHDHPHDKDGKWVKKGTGTFNVLANLKGTPKTAHYNSAGMQDDGTLVGGLSLHAPDLTHLANAFSHDPSPHSSIDYALGPGESVYLTTGTSNMAMIKHANGSATVLAPTDLDKPPQLQMHAVKADQLVAHLEKKGIHVDPWAADVNTIDPSKAAVAKHAVEQAAEQAKQDAEHAKAMTTPPKATPTPAAAIVDKTLPVDDTTSHTISGHTLTHSTGATIALKPGDTVYQHKKVKESLLIIHGDGNATKVASTNGKTQKAPNTLTAVLGTNYTKAHVVSAMTPVPGTGLSLHPGQSLYTSKGNKLKYAIVQDGKVIQLIWKETEEPDDTATKQILKNWQNALIKGTLIHQQTAPGGEDTAAPTPSVSAPKASASPKPPAAKKAAPVAHKPAAPQPAPAEEEMPEWEKELLGGGEYPVSPPEPELPPSYAPAPELPPWIDPVPPPPPLEPATPKPTTGKPVKPKILSKPATAVKIKKADQWKQGLPSEFQSPGGLIETLPGESVWQHANGQVIHVAGSGKIAAGWTGAGTKMPLSLLKGVWTPSKLLGGEWTPMAYGGTPTEFALPQGTVTEHFADLENAKKYMISKWTSANCGATTAVNDQYLALPGALNKVLAADEFIKTIADALATAEAAKAKFLDQLETSEKTKAGKTIKGLEQLLTIAVLYKKMADGGYLTPDEEATYKDVVPKAEHNGKFANYLLGNARDAVVQQHATSAFAASVSGLGFDLNNGSHADYLGYVNSKGVPFAEGMDTDDLKTWTLIDLGAPGFSNSAGTKDKLIAKAKAKLAFAAMAVHADAVVIKKQQLAPSAGQAKTAALVEKKLALSYKQLANMHQTYGDDTGMLSWSGEWGWTHKLSSGGSTFVTDLQALELSKDMDPVGPKIGSPAQKVANQIDNDFGPHALSDSGPSVVKALGGLHANKMTGVQQRTWMKAHLLGDMVWKHEIEKEAGGTGNNQGSPTSAEGAQARQALSNWLATQSWWPKNTGPVSESLSSWSSEDRLAAIDALGLAEAQEVAHGPAVSPPLALLQAWLEGHDNLPPAQTGEIHGTVASVDLGGGHVVAVHAGEYLTGSQGGHDFYLLKPDGFEHHLVNPADPSSWKVESHPYSGPMTGTQASCYANFLSSGDTDLTPTFAAPGHMSTLKATKPEGVSDVTWAASLGSEQGGSDWKALIGDWTTQSESMVQSAVLHGGYLPSNTGITIADRAALLQAPATVQRLAAWAFTEGSKNAAAFEMLRALSARAGAGEYLQPETETWTMPNGVKVSVPPGAVVYSGLTQPAMVFEGGTNGVMLHPSTGLPNSVITSSYTLDSLKAAGNKPVFESKANLGPDKALGEGFEFSQSSWDALSEAEKQTTWQHKQPEGAAAYSMKGMLALTSANTNDGTPAATAFADLPGKLSNLPVGVKQFALEAVQAKDWDKLTALKWKIGKGAYDQQPTTSTHLQIDPAASYATLVAQGKVSADDVFGNWDFSQLSDFENDHSLGVDLQYASAWEKSVAIAAKLAELAAPPAAAATAPSSLGGALQDTSHVQLTKIDKELPGMHTKQQYADQFGEEWMAKFFPHDVNAKARVDAEHYANVVGRMLGFNQPRTFVRDLDGQYSYVQHLAPASGDLKGKGPKDLNEDQLASAMSEHVLDWLLGNHDSHSENILLSPDGKTVIGIDKGQAFKNHHLDKLEVGYLPQENHAPVWYDQFYYALQSGKIDKETAQRIAERVMLKAFQTQQAQDQRFEETVGLALAKKTNYKKPYPNQAALTQAIMDRKHNLLKDFNDFYAGMFKKAGYEWTINPDDYGKKVGSAHIQNGPQFAEDVKTANALGKALMFNTQDLEASHLMMTPMVQKHGGTTLLGHGKVNADTDKKLTLWLKDKVQGPMASKQSVPEVVAAPEAQMPLLPGAHQATVAYAITLKHHSLGGKQPDEEYNMGTVKTAQDQVATLKTAYAKVLSWQSGTPDEPYTGNAGGVKFSTLEQQDAWLNRAETIINNLELCDQALAAKKPVTSLAPDKVPFTYESYTPTEGLGAPGGIAEKWQVGSGTEYFKTTDGGHYAVTPNAEKYWVSPQDYLAVVSTNHATKVSLASTDPAVAPGYPQYQHPNGSHYEAQPDGKWQFFLSDGTAGGSPIAEATMKSLMSSDPESWVYQSGQVVEEKSVAVQTESKKLTVAHAKSASHSGAVDKNGQLKEHSSGPTTDFQSGSEYVVTHDNVTIRYRSHTESGVNLAQRGVLQFEVKDWDGTHTQIDNVLDTFKIMGLDVTPADQQSLELQYWRQMLGWARDRAEGQQSGKYKELLASFTQARNASPNMSQADELELLKSLWSNVLGASKVANAQHEPQFGTWFGQEGGHPNWRRPDISVADLHKLYGNGTTTPITGITGSNRVARAVKVIRSGGMLSSEERVRVLGVLAAKENASGTTMSPGSDQSHGSSTQVFLRQNMDPFGYHAGSGAISFLIDPREALRQGSYAFQSDKFGDVSESHSAPMGAAMYKFSGSSNELCVKDGATVKYAVCIDSTTRSQLIAALMAEGITEVHGVPVDQFVLTKQDAQAKTKAMWDEIMKGEGQK